MSEEKVTIKPEEKQFLPVKFVIHSVPIGDFDVILFYSNGIDMYSD